MRRIFGIDPGFELVIVLLGVASVAHTQTYPFSTLASFQAGGPSGPSSLIIDNSGNLYETSVGGGKSGFGTGLQGHTQRRPDGLTQVSPEQLMARSEQPRT